MRTLKEDIFVHWSSRILFFATSIIRAIFNGNMTGFENTLNLFLKNKMECYFSKLKMAQYRLQNIINKEIVSGKIKLSITI